MNSKKKLIMVLVGFLLVIFVLAIGWWLMVRWDSESGEQEPTAKIKTCTTYSGWVEEQCIEDYIGLTQTEAESRAKEYGYIPKIAFIDGVGQDITDEKSYRIYLEIEKGIVVNAYFPEGVKYERRSTDK